MILFILLCQAGYFVHLLKEYQRYKISNALGISLFSYASLYAMEQLTTLVAGIALTIAFSLDGSINYTTAFTIGYTTDSFLKWLMQKV